MLIYMFTVYLYIIILEISIFYYLLRAEIPIVIISTALVQYPNIGYIDKIRYTIDTH